MARVLSDAASSPPANGSDQLGLPRWRLVAAAALVGRCAYGLLTVLNAAAAGRGYRAGWDAYGDQWGDAIAESVADGRPGPDYCVRTGGPACHHALELGSGERCLVVCRFLPGEDAARADG